jgi:hypothetical protein
VFMADNTPPSSCASTSASSMASASALPITPPSPTSPDSQALGNMQICLPPLTVRPLLFPGLQRTGRAGSRVQDGAHSTEATDSGKQGECGQRQAAYLGSLEIPGGPETLMVLGLPAPLQNAEAVAIGPAHEVQEPGEVYTAANTVPSRRRHRRRRARQRGSESRDRETRGVGAWGERQG